MDSETDKLRLFVNPFAIWTDLALKTGQAMWATAHAAAVRSNGPRVAVIPTADAPPEKARAAAEPAATMMASVRAAALRNAKSAAPDAQPPKRRAPAAPKTKAARFKAARAKARSQVRARSKSATKRRAKR